MKSVAVGLTLAAAVAASNDVSSAVTSWDKLVSAVKTASSAVKSWDGSLATSGTVISDLQTVGTDSSDFYDIISKFSDVTDSEAATLFKAVQSGVSAITDLLENSEGLKTKVGSLVIPVVSSQINSLQGGVYSIIDAFYSEAPCDYSATVVSVAEEINSGYVKLDSIFSVDTSTLPAFAHTTGCSASAAATTSAAASSSAVESSAAATTSAAASSSAVESSAAATTSAAMSSAAATTSEAAVATANSSTSSVPTTVATTNGAGRLVGGSAMALVLGSVALLM